MVRTARFRRQHDEIMAIVQEISSHLTNDLKKDARQVPQLLSTLAGKLTVHLAMEDNALYPSLLKDDQLRPLAEEFMGKWGVLARLLRSTSANGPTPGRSRPGRQSLSKKPRGCSTYYTNASPGKTRSFTPWSMPREDSRCPAPMPSAV